MSRATHGTTTSRTLLARRKFLRTLAGCGAALAAPRGRAIAAPAIHERRQPNLLFIHSDQQHASAISALGSVFGNEPDRFETPNLDRLVSRSVVFTESYSANPVCCPARTCWFTGRTSCENGVVMNSVPIAADMPDMGQWLGARGYEAHYAGKWHIPNRDLAGSFNVLTAGCGQGEHGDAAVSAAAEGFLRNYSSDKPFFLSLGYLQPHDICYWIMAHHHGVSELPYPEIADQLPRLPENFEFDPAEPETFRRVRRDGASKSRWGAWSETQWRYYLWAYYRHVEMVDAEIGRVMRALEDSRHADDTVVIFTSDHGEGLARHQTVLKGFLYDEAARVPMMISCPNRFEPRIDTNKLVSGLDVTPTLCELAGVDAPPRVRGRSLVGPASETHGAWRDFLVSESGITGRMLRTADRKLIRYSGDETKQLFDLSADAGESRNLANSSAHADELAYLERQLDDWESHLNPVPTARAAAKNKAKRPRRAKAAS